MIKHILLLIIISAAFLYSQEEHKHGKKEKESVDTTKYSPYTEMEMQKKSHSDKMHNRHGSGTAWLPNNSPMYGYMIDTDSWNFMIHGNLFLRYNNQDINRNSSRGDAKFDAPNWVMVMARNNISHSGLLRLTAMLSFDPVTVGGFGYPLLSNQVKPGKENL